MITVECITKPEDTHGFRQGTIYRSADGSLVLCTRDTPPNAMSFEGVLLYSERTPEPIGIGTYAFDWDRAAFHSWKGVLRVGQE